MFEITLSSFTRILVVGIMAYVSFLILLRISRKRTLSQLGMFDFIITIAFGSVLASTLLDSSISFLEGFLGFALLVALQFIFSFASVNFSWFSNLIKANPVMLFSNGEYFKDTMKKERILEKEILHSIRKQGIGSLEEVKAVVLETDGTLSIIKKTIGDALSDVKKPSK